MNAPTLNRERLSLIRDVGDGLVEERRTARGTEAIVRAREPQGTALSTSNWRWNRCGPRVRELIKAGWVAEVTVGRDDPGPWTYRLTDTGQAIYDEHFTLSERAA